MKKALLSLVSILGIAVVAGIVGVIFGLCPPDGPWPLPPWCEGSTLSWPISPKGMPKFVVTEIVDDIDQDPGDVAVDQPLGEEPSEVKIAAISVELFTDLSRIQAYFDNSIKELAEVAPEIAIGINPSGSLRVVHHASLIPDAQQDPSNIPPSFRGPLNPSGFMEAPVGACAAGADPRVQFQDAAGDLITAEKLDEEDVTVIDYEILAGENPEIVSLEKILAQSIVPGDPDLATPDGWNEKIWQPLKDTQTSMESLLDYQLWNSADDIEKMVISSIREHMINLGVPERVLNAFDQSNHEGWFASRYAEETNELATMHIVAEFSGDIQGEIEETRTFHIPGSGMLPEFGFMTGKGTVAFDHPELGTIVFDIEIEWTEWDDLGRVNVGTMNLIDQAGVYEILMAFLPDGTKQGELYIQNEYAGLVTLNVEGTSTYLDIKQNKTYSLDQNLFGPD
jgi:hypothetical protein